MMSGSMIRRSTRWRALTRGLALVAGLVVGAAAIPGGCGHAKVTSEQDYGPAVAKPAMIYVADFELEAANIAREPGVLEGRPGPVGRVGARRSGSQGDPEERARQLVDLMANSLVHDLKKEGFAAVRMAPGAPLPREGWLLRGVFVQVQEGNRMQRAMVGMGAGQTDLQVVTGVDDLSQGQPKPLYELTTEASSGQGPGAAPTVALNPYAAAARFVMAGHDMQKNVLDTASKIAAQVKTRVAESKDGKQSSAPAALP